MNCKPGDLAIAIDAYVPENEGMIVRVVHRHINTKEWNYTGIPAWWCESEQPMIWHFDDSGRVVQSHEGPIPDRNLRPIRPAAEGGGELQGGNVDQEQLRRTGDTVQNEPDEAPVAK